MSQEKGLPRVRSASSHGLARLIRQHIQSHALVPGQHLSAQVLADLFSASRTPVNQALRILAERGLVTHEPKRGYFVGATSAYAEAGLDSDPIEHAYRALARDRLHGRLPAEVGESDLRGRYGLTKAQMHLLLGRVMGEGWIERRVGHGWAFTEILTSGASLQETFRLRCVLEPASLLQPGYALDDEAVDRCRTVELGLLRGNARTMSVEALFERGARFHETLVGGCRNPFFVDVMRRVNRIRRLLSYEAMDDRGRYVRQAEEHLLLLDLVERGRLDEAASALLKHLQGADEYYSELLGGAR